MKRFFAFFVTIMMALTCAAQVLPALAEGGGGASAQMSDDALHFIIRHWHSKNDVTGSSFQGDSLENSGDRYFVVVEGYIVPKDSSEEDYSSERKYEFYLVRQDTKEIVLVHNSEEAENSIGDSAYVDELDHERGEIILSTNALYKGDSTNEKDKVERFSSYSVSAGHDAVAINKDILTIAYKENVHLVKAHAFYVKKTVDTENGMEDQLVFGDGGITAGNPEQDTAMVYTYKANVSGHKEGEVVKVNGTPFTTFLTNKNGSRIVDESGYPQKDEDALRRNGINPDDVEVTKVYDSSKGLQTDKSASVSERFYVDVRDEEGNPTGEKVPDGRTFDLDLEVWHSEGLAPQIGMVLDASGSMAFASDEPTPINLKNASTAVQDLLSYKAGTYNSSFKLGAEDTLVGYYEISQNSGSGGDSLRRNWYLNSVKHKPSSDYSGWIQQGYFAKLVLQPEDEDTIDFTNQKTLISCEDGGYTGWGAAPCNFSGNYGFNLTFAGYNGENSGFLLESASERTGDAFTLSFALKQSKATQPSDIVEILYIGPVQGQRSEDTYFRVIRSGSDIVAYFVSNGQVEQSLTLSTGFGNGTQRIITFAYDGEQITAYLDKAKTTSIEAKGLSHEAIVFAPFKDNNNLPSGDAYFHVDSICLFDEALNSDKVEAIAGLQLNKGIGNGATVEEIQQVTASGDDAFLTPEEVALLMNPHNTDNSLLGWAGYSYFVYNPASSTAAYCPLTYYNNGTNGAIFAQKNNAVSEANAEGWYYVSGAGWNNYKSDSYGKGRTAKTLYGLATGDYQDTIATGESTLEANQIGGTAPDVSSNENTEYIYDNKATSPVKFYLDKEGYLRCFYTASTNHFTSYVYELKDSEYIRAEALQRALGLFVTKLDEYSPSARVSAVRFSGAGANPNYLTELVLQDWTDAPEDSTSMLSFGQSDAAKRYVLTGGTDAASGLKAYREKLQGKDNPYSEGEPPRFLILFTDGKDDNAGSDNAKVEADILKQAGYTIYTVLLDGGSMGETLYKQAHDFLISLAGTDDPTTDPEDYFYSTKKAKEEAEKEGSDKYEGVSDADILTQVFVDEILTRVIEPLEDYTVQDYIDPRFDLVDIKGTVWHLNVGGKVVKGEGATAEKIDVTKKKFGKDGDDWVTITLSDDSDEAAQTPYLRYDASKDMYYLMWVEQTIPSSAIGANSLPVWNARVTIRAKDDFIGGNAVLTNGNDARENFVYATTDKGVASSGTDQAQLEREKDKNTGTRTVALLDEDDTKVQAYPSKGLPRVSVNVKPPKEEVHFEQLVYMGETLLSEEIAKDVIQQAYDNSYGLERYYWEYIDRFIKYFNVVKKLPEGITSTEEGVDRPHASDRLKEAVEAGELSLELLSQWLVKGDGDKMDAHTELTLPYIYLPDDPVDPSNSVGTGTHKADVIGWLHFKVEDRFSETDDDPKYPVYTEDPIRDTLSRLSSLEVTLELESAYDRGGWNNTEVIQEKDADNNNIYGRDTVNKPAVSEELGQKVVINSTITTRVVSGEVQLQLNISDEVFEFLKGKGYSITYSVDLMRLVDGAATKVGTFSIEVEPGEVKSGLFKTTFTPEEAYAYMGYGDSIDQFGLPIGEYSLTNGEGAVIRQDGTPIPWYTFSTPKTEANQEKDSPYADDDLFVKGTVDKDKHEVLERDLVASMTDTSATLGGKTSSPTGAGYTDLRFALFRVPLDINVGDLTITKEVEGDAPTDDTNNMVYSFTIQGPAEVNGFSFELSDGREITFTTNDADKGDDPEAEGGDAENGTSDAENGGAENGEDDSEAEGGNTENGDDDPEDEGDDPENKEDVALPTAKFTITGPGSVTIKELPAGTYMVTEEQGSAGIAGYKLTVSGDGSVTVVKDQITTCTITNKYERLPGSLTITKKVAIDGEEPDDPTFGATYTFKVTGPDAAKGKTYDLEEGGQITFNDSTPPEASVQITGSGSVTIKDLDTGAYTVEETDRGEDIPGYTYAGATPPGSTTVSIDWTSVENVTVTNNYTEMPGSLTITKKITIDGEEPDDPTFGATYTFEVTGPASVAGQTYHLEDGGQITFDAGTDETLPKATVTITGQGSVTIQGLPAGNYTVAEVTSADDDTPAENPPVDGGAVTQNLLADDDAAEGDTSDGDDATEDAEDSTLTIPGYRWIGATPASSTVTVPKGDNVSVEVTNNYTQEKGNLIISKTVSSHVNNDDSRPFGFTLTFTPPQGTTLKTSYNITGAQETTITLTPDTETGTYRGTVTLTHAQTVTIQGLPVGTQVTVAEDAQTDFTTEVAVNGGEEAQKDSETAIIEEGGLSFAFTNTRKNVSLVVSKTVAGKDGDQTKDWDFTVTLTPPVNVTLAGSYPYEKKGPNNDDVETGTLTVENGVISFKLKHGQTITISDLPYGTGYAISEADAGTGGYATTVTSTDGANGTLNKDITSVSYLNVNPAGVYIGKQVDHPSALSVDIGFTFTVRFFRGETELTDAEFAYQGVGNGGVAAPADGKMTPENRSVTLKGGQGILFADLPEGVRVEVTETEHEAFTTKVNGEDGLTGTGTVEREQQQINIAYTNTLKTANLTLSKLVAGDGGEKDKTWVFTVTLTPMTGVTLNEAYSCEGGVLTGITESVTAPEQTSVTPTLQADGTYTFDVRLKHGQTLTIKGLPYGTTYTVVETGAGENGYITSVSNVIGSAEPTDKAEGELKANATAAFTNTRGAGGVTISKRVVSGAADDLTKDFTFTVTFSVVGKDFDYTKTGTNGIVPGTIRSGNQITLRHGESVTITGLPVGTTVTVAETEDPDFTTGLVVTKGDDTNLGNTNSATVETANERISFAYTNTHKPTTLTVGKTVAGTASDPAKEWHFTVTLTAPTGGEELVGRAYTAKKTNADGTTTTEEGTIPENRQLTFTLAHDESITIENLPHGTGYTVVEAEANRDEYGTTATGMKNGVRESSIDGTFSGTLTVDPNIAYVNRNPAGGVTISKSVVSPGATVNKKFQFKVELTRLVNGVEQALDGSYAYSGTGKGPAGGRIKHNDTIELEDGQDITIEKLPEGTRVTVTETSAEAFDTAMNVSGGAVVAADRPNTRVVNDDKVTIIFNATNTLKQVDLKLSKRVAGASGEESKPWTFTVTLEPETGITLNKTYSCEGGVLPGITESVTKPTQQSVTLNGPVNGKYTFDVVLTHGQTLTIKGLPYGTKYEVAEKGVDPSAYMTTVSNPTGTLTASETAVDFTNTKFSGGVIISKTVVGDEANKTHAFTFQISLKDEKGAALKDSYRYTGSSVSGATAPADGSVSDGDQVTLAHGQSIAIMGLPKGAVVSVTETGDARYTPAVVPSTGSVTVDNDAQTLTIDFTNTLNRADLTIGKQVKGSAGDQDKAWDFTGTLTPPEGMTLADSYHYVKKNAKGEVIEQGELEVANGAISFKLKHDQTMTIQGLPNGTAYTVRETEANLGGYATVVSSLNDVTAKPGIGSISGALEGSRSVQFVNRNPAGVVEISKTVSGLEEADQEAWFEFAVQLTDANGKALTGSYPYEGSAATGVDAPENGEISHNGTIRLKHGQSVAIRDLPVGTKVKVSEQAHTGFTPTVTVTTTKDGVIDRGTNEAETIFKDDEDVYSFHFHNAREVGSLMVSKEVTGAAGDLNEAFAFTVTLTDAEGNPLAGGYRYTHDTAGSGTLHSGDTFTLRHNQSLTITGLPAGAKYRVEETAVEGYEIKATDDEGTIAANKVVHAAFVNEADDIVEPGSPSLELHKEQSRNGGERTQALLNVQANDVVTYYITVENKGDEQALNVVVTDEVPAGLILVETSVSNGTVKRVDDKQVIEWTLEKVEPLERIELSFQVRVPSVETMMTWSNIVTATYENQPEGEGPLTSERVSTIETVETTEPVGSLIVTKEVTGTVIDPEAEFIFTITLTDAYGNELSGAYSYTYGTVIGNAETPMIALPNGGSGMLRSGDTFTLKHNQSLTITGLPEGTRYKVEETAVEGYETEASGDEGVITAGMTAHAAFVNSSNLPTASDEPTAEPTVEPTEEPTEEPTVEPGVPGIELHKYQSLNGGERTQALLDVRADDVVRYDLVLENTGGVQALNVVVTDEVPAGLILLEETITNNGVVKMVDGKQIIEWTLEAVNPLERIELSFQVRVPAVESTTMWSNIATAVIGSLSEGEGTLTSERVDLIERVEASDEVGDLTVSKTVTGNAGDKTQPFSFMVMLSDTSINGVYGDVTFHNGVASFTLRHGESVTATGLPVGVRYSVSELAAAQSGYAVTSLNEQGVIQANTRIEVLFVNAREESDVPQTGDHSHLETWIALALAALLGMAMSALILREERRKKTR